MAQFRKGQSGNPKGRRRGTSQADKLRKAIEEDLPVIIKAMVDRAKDGDTAAAKVLLDRAVPTIKPVQQSGKVVGAAGKSLSEQAKLIFEASCDGSIAADTAQQLLAGLSSLSRIQAVDEFEQRLIELEKKQQ